MKCGRAPAVQTPIRASTISGVHCIQSRPEADEAPALVSFYLIYMRDFVKAGFLTDMTDDALPYHLWANRQPGSMQVWIAEAVE